MKLKVARYDEVTQTYECANFRLDSLGLYLFDATVLGNNWKHFFPMASVAHVERVE